MSDIDSEVSRVAAILREDIARAKADGKRIISERIFRRSGEHGNEIVACNVIGAALCRMDRGVAWRAFAVVAKDVGISDADVEAIADGFDMGDTVHSDPWRLLGQELAREEGLS